MCAEQNLYHQTSTGSRLWQQVRRRFSRESASSTLNTASNNAATSTGKLTAREVLYRYYECYNAGDLASIEPLIAQDVSYHDMAIYEEPFEGKQEFMAYLRRVKATVPSDIKFVIDDATDGDSSRVGIMWHVECGPANTPFPFSRGCSFYTVNDRGQITHARDLVESPNKPGAAALQLLAAIAPVVRELGPASDPSTLKKLPIGAAALWAFYVGYISYIMLGTSAPGLPAYATPPDVLAEVLSESINLFWINSALSSQGLSFIPDVVNPPVSEACFNFVTAWGLLFLPVLLTDGQSRKVGNISAWWGALWFLTNVFFIPFLALRAAPEPISPPATTTPASAAISSSSNSSSASGGSGGSSGSSGSPGTSAYLAAQSRARALLPPPPPPDAPLPAWTPAVAVFGLGIGLLSIWWALEGRPEYGGYDARWAYFVETFNTNRVFYAFILDAGLYSVWQAVLLKNSPAGHRFVPFFGLVAHLLAGGSPTQQEEKRKSQQ
ncbi:MAG: hypothetical protein WDW36_004407 [Sanguina aurantia]